MLFQTLKIPTTKVKYSNIDLVKKSLKHLRKQSHQQFEDEKAINPFDLRDEGANFKIKIRKVDGYWNYDKSEFDTAAPLFD